MAGTSKTWNEIGAANEQFMSAFNGGDAAGVAALYSDGAELLPPGSDVITSRQGIQSFWQAVMQAGIKTAELKSIEVTDHGNDAYEVGQYVLRLEGGALADQGKYVVIWTADGLQWKLHRDIWNTSRA